MPKNTVQEKCITYKSGFNGMFAGQIRLVMQCNVKHVVLPMPGVHCSFIYYTTNTYTYLVTKKCSLDREIWYSFMYSYLL